MKRAFRAAAAALTALLVLTPAPFAPRLPARAGETGAESVSDETAAAGEDSYDSRIAQEKAYLLEALDQMQEWGFSPIAIWAGITGDDSVLEIIESAAGASDSLSETLSEAGSNAVSDITESVTEAVTDAVEEQTEKVKQSFLEQIRSMINNFLDNL